MRDEVNKIRLHIRAMKKARGDTNREVRIGIPEFTVGRGDFIAVLGSNGSGKSTLLDILGLILSPDRAEEFALVTDNSSVDLRKPSRELRIRLRRRYFAYVLQTGGLLEFLDVRENIRLAARLSGKPFAKVEAKVEKAARLLGIEDIMGKYPGKVSGGQRQKAAIARALVQDPEVILADEPTSALDAPSARKLIGTFHKLTGETGASLVMATHDYGLVQDSADRFYHFRTGVIDDRTLASVLLSGLPPTLGRTN